MKIIQLAIFVLMFVHPITSQNKDSLLNDLLLLTGEVDLGKNVLNDEISHQKTVSPEIETAFWIEFMRRLESNNYVQMKNLIYDVYDKHFEIEDLEEILKFYRTKSGRKLLENQPKIIEESRIAGEKLGFEIAQSIMNDLETIKRNHFEIELEGCDLYKEGAFIMNFKGELIEVDRTERINLERKAQEEIELEIEWIKDCRYILKNSPMPDSTTSDIIVNIYEHLDDGYIYSARLKSKDFYIEGEVFFRK